MSVSSSLNSGADEKTTEPLYLFYFPCDHVWLTVGIDHSCWGTVPRSDRSLLSIGQVVRLTVNGRLCSGLLCARAHAIDELTKRRIDLCAKVHLILTTLGETSANKFAHGLAGELHSESELINVVVEPCVDNAKPQFDKETWDLIKAIFLGHYPNSDWNDAREAINNRFRELRSLQKPSKVVVDESSGNAWMENPFMLVWLSFCGSKCFPSCFSFACSSWNNK